MTNELTHFDIFLSHAHNDAEIVERLAVNLTDVAQFRVKKELNL